METTIITFIIWSTVSIIVALLISKTSCFNSDVDSLKGINITEFEVIEINKHYSTRGRVIAEYIITNSYFKRKNARGWVYKQYKFYDEPGKYKIGDKLTLK